ncbi:MAG: GvpL/GvpF family gas vesicle protein, partial [Methanomassiliicoccales archaeon]
ILPFGFDTIIKPAEGREATEVLRKWLQEERANLTNKMARIEGKKEYGVQVFYAPARLIEKAIRESEEVRSLKEEMGSKSPGAAYMLKQKLETAVRREMEQEAEDRLQEFLALIKAAVDDICVEKNKKGDKEQVMLLNLSVLVGDDTALKVLLDEIDAQEAFSVRFTGPWPPYSFV